MNTLEVIIHYESLLRVLILFVSGHDMKLTHVNEMYLIQFTCRRFSFNNRQVVKKK